MAVSTKVKCHKCGVDLEVVESYVDSIGDIVIKIKPCENLDCRDCRECEVEQRLQKVRYGIS